MPDPIYVDSIKVSAGPFTVRTGRSGKAIVQRRVNSVSEWRLTLEDLELLRRAIGEYLHMRAME